MNLRTVGKIGFLLVIIGFFMPVACDQNGFELAKYFIEAEVIIGILMYLVFISAIVGVILGVLLLQNKDVSNGFEWFCLSVCIASGLIVYFTQLEGGPELQSGAYMILTGWIIGFIFQIIPDSNNRRRYSPNKRCRQCGTIYSGSQSSCPKCNCSLYEETNQSMDGTVSTVAPINANYGDTWTCKKCGEKNPTSATSCKGCGEYK
jgi:ribosomal protein L40E